jgi:hypothetical protein
MLQLFMLILIDKSKKQREIDEWEKSKREENHLTLFDFVSISNWLHKNYITKNWNKYKTIYNNLLKTTRKKNQSVW